LIALGRRDISCAPVLAALLARRAGLLIPARVRAGPPLGLTLALTLALTPPALAVTAVALRSFG
jgi:hypothetical protein